MSALLHEGGAGRCGGLLCDQQTGHLSSNLLPRHERLHTWFRVFNEVEWHTHRESV